MLHVVIKVSVTSVWLTRRRLLVCSPSVPAFLLSPSCFLKSWSPCETSRLTSYQVTVTLACSLTAWSKQASTYYLLLLQGFSDVNAPCFPRLSFTGAPPETILISDFLKMHKQAHSFFPPVYQNENWCSNTWHVKHNHHNISLYLRRLETGDWDHKLCSLRSQTSRVASCWTSDRMQL